MWVCVCVEGRLLTVESEEGVQLVEPWQYPVACTLRDGVGA